MLGGNYGAPFPSLHSLATQDLTVCTPTMNSDLHHSFISNYIYTHGATLQPGLVRPVQHIIRPVYV